MIALITKEKSPKVMMLKGRVIMLKIGLTIANNIARTMPPTIYVAKPPDTLNPDIACEVTRRATA